MTAAILFITIGGIMVYSALKGISVTDVLKGVTGDALDPKGGHKGGSGPGGSPDPDFRDIPDVGGFPSGQYGFKGPHAALLTTLATAAEKEFHLEVTSVCRGRCRPNCGSLHEQCRAFDSAGSLGDMSAFAKWAWETHGDDGINELFFAPAMLSVDEGVNQFPKVFDTPNHVHIGA